MQTDGSGSGLGNRNGSDNRIKKNSTPVGAIVGGFIMRALGFASQGGMIYTILVAIVGAVILTLIVRLVSGGSKRNL